MQPNKQANVANRVYLAFYESTTRLYSHICINDFVPEEIFDVDDLLATIDADAVSGAIVHANATCLAFGSRIEEGDYGSYFLMPGHGHGQTRFAVDDHYYLNLSEL